MSYIGNACSCHLNHCGLSTLVYHAWSIITSPSIGERSIVMTMSVCLFVCLFTYITRKPQLRQTTTSAIFMHDAYGCHGSVLLWRRCDTLSTSGFVDDIRLSYHGANKPESSTTLYFEEVRQEAVSIWAIVASRVCICCTCVHSQAVNKDIVDSKLRPRYKTHDEYFRGLYRWANFVWHVGCYACRVLSPFRNIPYTTRHRDLMWKNDVSTKPTEST